MELTFLFAEDQIIKWILFICLSMMIIGALIMICFSDGVLSVKIGFFTMFIASIIMLLTLLWMIFFCLSI